MSNTFGQVMESHLVTVIEDLLQETSYYDRWTGKPKEAPADVPKDRLFGSKDNLSKRLTHTQSYLASKFKDMKDLQDKDHEISARFAKRPGSLKKHKAAFQKTMAEIQDAIENAKSDMESTKLQLGIMQNHEHGGIKQDSGNMRREIGAREGNKSRNSFGSHAGSHVQEAATKKKFRVITAHGGKELSNHDSKADAFKSASVHSHKAPVHVWTNTGGHFGMGSAIAHYSDGKQTLYKESTATKPYTATGSYTNHPFHSTLVKHGYEHEVSHDDEDGGRVHSYFHPKTQQTLSLGATNGKPAWETHDSGSGTSKASLQKTLAQK